MDKKISKNKVILGISLIVLFSTIVFGANFIFDKVAWNNTQDFFYESGRGQERVANEFEIDSVICGGIGTIYDKITNLCWQKNMSSYLNYSGGNNLNWSEAQNYCNNLLISGGSWRLPDKAELMTLLYYNGTYSTEPRLLDIGFNGIKNSYWSNSRYEISSPYYVGFVANRGYQGFLTSEYSVVCVKTAS